MESASEARRRRLRERGSERLAFITGQTRSFPPPMDDDSQPHDHEIPAIDAPQSNLSTPIHEDSPAMVEEASTEPLAADVATRTADPFPQSDEPKPTELINKHNIVEEQKEIVKTTQPPAQRSPENKNKYDHRLFFSPSQISHAITISENIRLICAVIISLLAIKGIVGSRPLFLVILSDLTVVIGLLMGNKVTNKNEKEKEKEEERGADKIGQALEIGFLLQKASNALFMDCSVCAIIIICALAI